MDPGDLELSDPHDVAAAVVKQDSKLRCSCLVYHIYCLKSLRHSDIYFMFNVTLSVTFQEGIKIQTSKNIK